MKTKIVITNNFEKEAKRLLKKYKSLKAELNSLYTELSNNPHTGVPIGKNAYKIRLQVKSKGKGKRGGLRVITYLEISLLLDDSVDTLFLLSVYDKSESESISNKELVRLISKLRKES